MRAVILIFAGLLLGAPAFAQDDETDPFQLDDDDPTFGQDPSQPQPQPRPAPDLEDPEPDLEFQDGPTPGPDLLGDDPAATGPESGDTADLYRDTLKKVEGLDPDDEMQVWDEYLRKYPNSPFKGQIEARVDTLEKQMYDTNRIRPKDPVPTDVDADRAELKFSQGLLIENINPRRRLQLTVEWGLPDYANLGADYEHAILRSFSVHGGIRRRFTGASIEGGARWALVKSARTQTLLTFIGDVHLNASPAFIGFRPQLAFGKRFGKADVQVQAGVDIAPRALLDLRILGGANLTYRASEAVAMFAETSLYMKSISGEAGPYRFNQFTFGMKFFPGQKAKDPEKTEVNLGASIPYSSAYWQYHYGSLMGQANIYL
jgi:hypothetical protein